MRFLAIAAETQTRQYFVKNTVIPPTLLYIISATNHRQSENSTIPQVQLEPRIAKTHTISSLTNSKNDVRWIRIVNDAADTSFSESTNQYRARRQTAWQL